VFLRDGRLMLTVLGGLVEFERELIRIRTGEGRTRGKENGISLGRKSGAKFLRTRVREHPFLVRIAIALG
jgi:DNA invertase Pin-like site-specific DNA recombinase